MSTPRIAKHYTRLLSLWPKDPLRPNLPFTSALEHRIKQFEQNPVTASTSIPSSTSPSAKSSSPASKTSTSKSTKAATTPKAPTPIQSPAQSELLNVNALYSLVENRYSKRYPTSPGLLRPTSNPEYYETLMAEIERAPNKSWLKAVWDEWRMKVRWQ
ncbi:hypothetical protein GQ43DRAFT_463544 [Delitschia confertaspora ATCC 74209]|uniref:Ubiquinol-cytochrome-c reductase complex assembly factor 2 n=1 Tax=Delitschia confertaspora ATCC 74209 TaxID=1513339 RepID=A0A9P4JML2_9PLEO|nr:hypothetical protein GQ43DRAFT_463544 [Delitschia confertaspora ATCC 74209]